MRKSKGMQVQAHAVGRNCPLPMLSARSSTIGMRSALKIGWLHPDGIGAVSRGNVAIFFRKITAPFAAAIHWVFAEDIDATLQRVEFCGCEYC
jgi:hypothetical protein